MKTVNLVTVHNRVGLTRSAALLADALRNGGFEVHIQNLPEDDLRKPVQPLPPPHTFDVNIFLERLHPRWFQAARMNCLVPNQEWFLAEDRPLLHQMDWILCKTHYAQTIFDGLGCRTAFIGFTSKDRFDPAYARNYETFFHLAGRSQQKGTQLLVDLWERHPEWPELVIVQHSETALPIRAGNIHYCNKYLEAADLRRYQNTHSLHLCPSEAEGFGHYIVEGMCCEALVLTTDAPPMNELVTPARGVLVPYATAQRQRLGTNFYVDPGALEAAIEGVLAMDPAQKVRLAKAGRAWYEENDRRFRQRSVSVLKERL